MATASPSQVNFLIFASIYSMISVVFLEVVPRMFPRGNYPIPVLARKQTYDLENENN